jgi:hypothetical protein
LIPQDCIDEENEYLKRELGDDENLLNLFRVSENGMKQYRRTRTEASKEGIKIAKKLVKNKVLRYIHPLISGCDPKRCDTAVVEKADFIRQLQKFRPAQTVFETGIGTSSNQATKRVKDSSGALVVKAFRNEIKHALERNKPEMSYHDLLASNADAGGGGVDDDDDNDDDNDDDIMDDVDHEEGAATRSLMSCDGGTGTANDKIRLSKAERKRLKKQNLPLNTKKMRVDSADVEMTFSDSAVSKKSFQDARFYMSYGTEDEKATFSEASMQPKSNLRDREAQSANMLESALLDVAPDTATDLNSKRRFLRWDAKKRKFVKQSLEEMAQSKGHKRVRTESGAVMNNKAVPGEFYEKWKKKTRREISIVGGDERERPQVKVNTNVKSELRSAQEIRKSKKTKSNLDMKNMAKDKRRKVEAKGRKKKSASSDKNRLGTKAGNRRVKVLVR